MGILWYSQQYLWICKATSKKRQKWGQSSSNILVMCVFLFSSLSLHRNISNFYSFGAFNFWAIPEYTILCILYKCWRYHSIFSGSTGYQMRLESPSVGAWEQRTYVWIGILNCLNIILVAQIHSDCRCVFVCTVCSLYMNGIWMYPQWLLVCVLPPYASMGKQRKVHASPRFLEGQSKTPRKDASRYVQKKCTLYSVFICIYRLKIPAPIWIVWVIYLLQMVTHQHVWCSMREGWVSCKEGCLLQRPGRKPGLASDVELGAKIGWSLLIWRKD